MSPLLPSLPPLPPLEMPDDIHSPAFSPSIPPDDPKSVPFSPTPSFAESFSTAYTSPQQPDLQKLPTPALSPTYALRKSLSVDSFVQSGRDQQHAVLSTLRSDANSAASGSNPLRSNYAQNVSDYIGRNRGFSVGSSRGHRSSTYYGDSDVERSDVLVHPIERYPRTSLKGQDAGRPIIRGGELPLPSRSAVLAASSSSNSLVSATSKSSTKEDIPRQQSVSSLHSLPGRSTINSSLSGRVRSGSLGMHGNPARLTAINTQAANVSSNPLSESAQFESGLGRIVTIAVIGVSGSGKSVVIRKGLRGYGLTESATISALHHSSGMSLNYSRRVGKISRIEGSLDCALHVIEIGVPQTLSPPVLSLLSDQSLEMDGVVICYDSSNQVSFRPVEELLRLYHALKLPIVVLSCKSDLGRQIEPEKALEVLQQYDVGLVEVAKTQDPGKEKMRRTFEWLLKAVFRHRRTSRTEVDSGYRNPASPDLLVSPLLWETSRNDTPIGSQPTISSNVGNRDPPPAPALPANATQPPEPSASASEPLHTPADRENAKLQPWPMNTSEEVRKKDSADSSRGHVESAHPSDNISPANDGRERTSRPAQWATLDELLDKLLFLTVSGDDPAYINHFLLTYRRFASPRSVLLAMQKRMRLLDNPSGDPMFACYAQMRICSLLEQWIKDYPSDFAVRGTAGALSALIKSIISKTYLLHYGSEFLRFLEMVPTLVDGDTLWSFKADIPAEETDDDDEDDDDDNRVSKAEVPPSGNSPASGREKRVEVAPISRERKTSLPLPLILATGSSPNPAQAEPVDSSDKQQIKDLVKLAQEVLSVDPDEIAQEITRVEVKLFLDIKPRHWLFYTFVPGKKDEKEPITAFNSVSNHLADWVVSLILCHDRSRARVKQIEKFVEIAHRLRVLNNYSALRAFVAGINAAALAGDDAMEQFKSKSPEQAKNFQSWDVLLQQIRSHRAYRLALRNTKGPCIPALEVHISDLIKAHEGNEDLSPSDPTKIHWGKFNMMGRFISSTVQCQAQCKDAPEYRFPERSAIRELFVKRPVMSLEMQKSRMALPSDFDDNRPVLNSHSAPNPPNVAILRKLFFW